MSRKLDAAIADAQGYEVVYAKTYERGEIRENRNMPELKIYDDCRMGCPCYSSDACAMLELDAHMRARGVRILGQQSYHRRSAQICR